MRLGEFCSSRQAWDAARKAGMNCLVLWHATCMLLGVNRLLIEGGGGFYGVDAASRAFGHLKAWAHRATARRACLHACAIYALLSQRRLSDSLSLQTETALFYAAMTFGIHLMLSSATQHMDFRLPLEVTEEVDFSTVRNLGFTDNDELDAAIGQPELGLQEQTTHPTDFVLNGANLTLSGTTLSRGYNGARQVALHFADVMEGIKKPRSRHLARLLHIVSDNLAEVALGESREVTPRPITSPMATQDH